MNFLSHIYLSKNNERLMVGNFMGDFVKGSNFDEYHEHIQKGIFLHRLIDEFTDNHPIVHQSKDRLRSKYRHYAGVIVDVYYDHFLAKNWGNYHPEPLHAFTHKTYETLNTYKHIMPKKAQYMLPYMIEGNWLLNYAKTEGIHQALSGMSRRTKFDSKIEQSTHDLKASYDYFEQEFTLFFTDINDFTQGWIDKEFN